MRTDEMMKSLGAYYGETYSGIFSAIIAEYLDGLSDRLRRDLFQVVIKRFSRRWGKAPDVAAFEDLLDEAQNLKVYSTTPEIEHRDALTDAERDELARLMDEARKTPEGRMLLGAIGRSGHGA